MRDREEKHSILPIQHTTDSNMYGIFATLESVKDLNSTKLTIEELSNQIVERTRLTLKVSCVSLWLVSNQQKNLTLQAFSSIDSTESDTKKYNVSLDEPSPVVDCWLTSKSAINKKQSLAEIDPRAENLTNTYNSTLLPLKNFGKAFGVLEILTGSHYPVHKNELETLEVLAGQISLLVANLQNIEEAESQTALQKQLYEITHKFNIAKDIDSILQITVEEICSALNLPGAQIHINLAALTPLGEPNTSSSQEVVS